MGNKGSSHKSHKDRKDGSLLSQSGVTTETKCLFRKQDLKLLESMFVEIENQKDHTLDKTTFLKLFPLASGLLGERLYLEFDTTGDNAIDFNEFLHGIGQYVKGTKQKRIEFLFDMFDYSHQGQLTRYNLSLMLHALIIDQEVVDDFDDFEHELRDHGDHRASMMHCVNNFLPGELNIENIQKDDPLTIAKDPHDINSNSSNEAPSHSIFSTVDSNKLHLTQSPSRSSAQFDFDNVPPIPQKSFSNQHDQPSPSKPKLLHQSSTHQLHTGLSAEEQRVTNLLQQLHDPNLEEHVNIMAEITIAAKIGAEQEKITIDQFVDFAFKTVPIVSPEQNNPSDDYMTLCGFETYISRNPSIIETLEEILDVITWLDPRTDEQRRAMHNSRTKGDSLSIDSRDDDLLCVEDKPPQNLCCQYCGFSALYCPLCASYLKPNTAKTFSVCSNETTGLCGDWTTEGKFDFCLQCGKHLQNQLPTDFLVSHQPSLSHADSGNQQSFPPTHNTRHQQSNSLHLGDLTLVPSGDPSVTIDALTGKPIISLPPLGTPQSKAEFDHSVLASLPQSPLPNIHPVSPNLDKSSSTAVSADDASQPHHLSLTESPHHQSHTLQHGYHTGTAKNSTRSSRASSNHLSQPSPGPSLAALHKLQTSNRSTLAEQHGKHVHYEGQAYVRSSGLIKHLKSRWLLCRGGFLYKFKDRDDTEPHSVIFLEGSFVQPMDEENEKSDTFGLEIKTRTHRHLFYFKQLDHRQTWVKILRQASKTQSIGDFYTFKKQIGKGKFATVYEAVSKLNSRSYAVKVVSKLLMERPEELEQLRAEISIIKLAHHPHIIRMKEMFEDVHNIYLIMPLINGGDMFDRILLRQTFPEDTAKSIIWRLLSAIEYLHEREIVHCDIKPENILLVDDEHDDNVILADFGLSSFFDPACGGMHRQQGTISYVAPEVLRGQSYTKSIDVYSLGVCAYLFLCGQLPFQGYTQEEIIKETLSGKLYFGPEWDEISTNAREFVSKLLSPQSSDRPSATVAIQHPWFDSLRSEATFIQQTKLKQTMSTRQGDLTPLSSLQPNFSNLNTPVFTTNSSAIHPSTTPMNSIPISLANSSTTSAHITNTTTPATQHHNRNASHFALTAEKKTTTIGTLPNNPSTVVSTREDNDMVVIQTE